MAGSLRRFLRARWLRLAAFLAVVGPGIITANVDNDAGGITTYSQAGAHFGLATVWVLAPIMVVLIMVQEMVNRMGIVTGQGLSDLIRERYGVRITFFLMLALLLTNLGNVIAEFAGIAAAMELFGVSRYVAVPLCAFGVWFLVLRWPYRVVEKVFLFACLFYVAYLISGAMVAPSAQTVARELFRPRLSADPAYLLMIVGLAGTTIAPWMQFYQQAAVVEKGISLRDVRLSTWDTVLGGVVVTVVALFIIVTCSETLFRAGVRIDTAADAARALIPVAGAHAAYLFALGLLAASLFAASILPLSTSYTVCEAFGWESGVDRSYRQAPQFYVLYSVLVFGGAATVLFPDLPLVDVMYYSQVVNGLLLPVILVFILRLAGDPAVLGERVNGPVYNVVCWTFAVVIAALSATSLAMVLFG
ncbi:MAG: Nramp family divalent metal transporter [Deltaproteobacteria bacterium]|nr:Nramp family divalent metal transporter [Deltaproteobacteria bacterium]